MASKYCNHVVDEGLHLLTAEELRSRILKALSALGVTVSVLRVLAILPGTNKQHVLRRLSVLSDEEFEVVLSAKSVLDK